MAAQQARGYWLAGGEIRNKGLKNMLSLRVIEMTGRDVGPLNSIRVLVQSCSVYDNWTWDSNGGLETPHF